MSVLRADNLVKIYGRRKVVDQVSIEVAKGEIIGLLGPNGAGKTTTFYMVTGMIKPSDGDIFLDDSRITKLPMYKRARRGIGYLCQESSVFRKLSVEDNIMAILQLLKISRKERRERLDTLMEELKITHLRKSKAFNLSGGERRRLEITRALAVKPDFILLDEPFAGIDPIAVADIQEIVRSLKERQIGVLITDHNVHETLSIVDRAYLIFEGKILKTGTAEYLAEDAEARKLYLGDNFKLDR